MTFEIYQVISLALRTEWPLIIQRQEPHMQLPNLHLACRYSGHKMYISVHIYLYIYKYSKYFVNRQWKYVAIQNSIYKYGFFLSRNSEWKTFNFQFNLNKILFYMGLLCDLLTVLLGNPLSICSCPSVLYKRLVGIYIY